MKYKDRPILIIIGNNKNGGIAKHATMLANGLAKTGKKVTILVTKDGTDESYFNLREGVMIKPVTELFVSRKSLESLTHAWEIKFLKVICRILPKNFSFQKKLAYLVSKKRKTFPLRCAIKAYNNPIIIAMGLDYAIDTYFAARGVKCSLIYGTRTSAENEIGEHDRTFIRNILKHFCCLVSQTRNTANYFLNIGIKQVEVIGNPLEVEVAPFYGVRNKNIVNFCRISKEKNLRLLIQAFSKFHLLYPEYKIDIYGNIVTKEEQEHKDELLSLIECLDLSAYVKIHPARKDIHETIRNAGMFISTSNYEGLSNSMIEAMAIGVPCICTDCDGGGAREFIKHGVNGLLIPKNNEAALVGAMRAFAGDVSFSNRCAESAMEIRQQLNLDSIVSQWDKIINHYCN